MARKITKQAEFVVAENPLPKVLIRIILAIASSEIFWRWVRKRQLHLK